MIKLIDYVFSARPLLHLPVWSVYLVSLHYCRQPAGGGFEWSHLIMMTGLSLMAAGAYYLNQIYDYDSDLINRKLGFLQRGLASDRGFMIAYLATSAVGVAIACSFSVQVLLIYLQGFVFAYIYSAPPLRLKDRPVAGLLANAYAFGFLLPFTIMPDLSIHNAGLFAWDAPFYFFLTVASIHIMTTLPDREGDLATGKRTMAVLLGGKPAKLLASGLMFLSAIIAWGSHHPLLTYLSIFSLLIILVSAAVRSHRLELLAAKLPLLLLTLLAGHFYPGYLLFIVALVIATRIYYWKRFGIVYPRLA